MSEGSRGQGSGVKGQGYRQLVAWQRSHQLALALFQDLKPVKSSERWFYQQCMRSALSVPANIAEGYSRGSLREYIQFLNIARGSLAETEYYIQFATAAGLLPAERAAPLDKMRRDAASPLLGLIRSLQDKNGLTERVVKRVEEEQTEYSILTPDPLTRDPSSAPEAR